MKITLEQAHGILDDASAIIVDNVVTYAALEDLTGEPDNEWCCITWEDGGLEFRIKWDEDANPRISDDTGELVMRDTEGDDVWITILGKRDLNNPGGSNPELLAALVRCDKEFESLAPYLGRVFGTWQSTAEQARLAVAKAKGGAA